MREIMLVKTRQVRRHEYVNNKGENRHSIKFSSGGEQFTLVFQNEAERDLCFKTLSPKTFGSHWNQSRAL